MKENSLSVVSNHLLSNHGLSENHLQKLLDSLMKHQVDFAEVYMQNIAEESLHMEEGLVKSGSSEFQQGVGIRANVAEKTGYAYADDIDFQTMLTSADVAKQIARSGQETQSICTFEKKQTLIPLYSQENPLNSITMEQKLSLLKSMDKLARQKDSRVKEVFLNLSGVHENVLIANSRGLLQGDIRPLVRLNVNVIVEQNGRRESASFGGGGRFGYDVFLSEKLGESYVEEAVRQALIQLDALPAPSGLMPVVLGPGWPGVLLHEAIGHGLEGDFNRQKTSAFSGRIGQRVASPLCTIVDNGTIAKRRGSLSIDDEGTPTQCTTLIEKGILKGYMQDNLNARLMKQGSTGNGRRESYAHKPMPRMTNTYMLAGPHDPQEIIQSVEKGLYAVQFGGGQVDITSGKFVFNATEAYLIENGKVTAPVKGAMLIGNGPDVLTKVSMLGNDLALDQGVGTCGKDGQSVPVGVGQPTLKIDELTVGGTNA